MKKIEDECRGCHTEGYPCVGSACEYRKVLHLYCDICGEDVEEVYEVGNEDICEECLPKCFDKVSIYDS